MVLVGLRNRQWPMTDAHLAWEPMTRWLLDKKDRRGPTTTDVFFVYHFGCIANSKWIRALVSFHEIWFNYRFELLWALPDLEKLQRRLNTLPRPSSVPWGWTFGDRSGRPLVWCRKFPRWNGIPFPKGYANLVRGLSTYQRKWLTTNYSLRHFQVD